MRRTAPIRGILLAAALVSVALTGAGCAVGGVSRDQEVQLGQQTAAEIERKYRTWEDPTVTRLGLRVAAVSDRPDYPYRYRVIDDREVNAFALPGGPVYVTSGMMSFIGNDQGQLAGVLGHETAHVARRHAAEQIQRQSWLGLGISILTGGNSTLQAAATLAANLEELGFSRNQERDADTYGAVYMTRANMDPQGEVRLLQRLAAQGGGGGIAFLRTHPSGSERVTRLQGQLQGGEIRRLAGQ